MSATMSRLTRAIDRKEKLTPIGQALVTSVFHYVLQATRENPLKLYPPFILFAHKCSDEIFTIPPGYALVFTEWDARFFQRMLEFGGIGLAIDAAIHVLDILYSLSPDSFEDGDSADKTPLEMAFIVRNFLSSLKCYFEGELPQHPRHDSVLDRLIKCVRSLNVAIGEDVSSLDVSSLDDDDDE
jgi:hypothetical protein